MNGWQMARRRPKVLVVDGDREASLSLHRVLYEGNHRFDVMMAATAEVAREIMRDVGIDVLVTDADLPGTKGVDLVCWAAIEFPETLYVVKTSHDVAELRESIEGLGCMRLLRKPCEAREVLKIVNEALDCLHRLSGCFSALSAADLIQMLCLAQRTAALRITAQGVVGTVMVKDGDLLHATWGTQVGMEALCSILAAQDGTFRTTPLPGEVDPSIHLDWQHALMEAVRRLDEQSNKLSPRQSGSFPAIRIDESTLSITEEKRRGTSVLAGFEARQHARTPGVSSSLVDKGFAALRAGNVEEARQFWLAAKKLDPENRSIDLNLKKLDSKAIR
jgi:DNA-binding response OmpR family regulator